MDSSTAQAPMPTRSSIKIERPPLYLGENAANVFAEDAKRQQLNAGKKRNRNNQRGIAWNIDAENERASSNRTAANVSARNEVAEPI